MEIDKTGLLDRTFEVTSLTNSRCYLFAVNMSTRVSRWSQNAVEYFNLPDNYIYQASLLWENLVHPDDLADNQNAYNTLWNHLADRQEFEFRVRNKNGEYVFCSCIAIIIKGENGDPDLLTGTIINHGIQEYIDPITNLHSHQAFIHKLHYILEKHEEVTVMKIGINMFNHYNVLYGYESGNHLLKKLGKVLKESAQDHTDVYRLDGAKFAIIIYGGKSENEIKQLYSGIKHVANHKIRIKNVTVPISISGSAIQIDRYYEGSEITIKSSLSYAIGQSKHEQHGELVFFHDDRSNDEARKLKMLSVIHKSILNGCEGFYMCYQPLIDTKTGRVAGAEALLRWRDPTYGEVPPGVFLPWLETDPVFYPLGKWILETALAEIAPIKKKYPDFILNVNITASQLERNDFRRDVIDAVEGSRFPANDLFLELTERCRKMDLDYLRSEMDFFHIHNIKLSLDDFGTGSSSMALLKAIPVDEIKVDMSFIRNIENNKIDQALVKSIIQASNEMGLKVCLEGVETEGIQNYLNQFPVTYYQGYYYSKPIPIGDFIEYLRENS